MLDLRQRVLHIILPLKEVGPVKKECRALRRPEFCSTYESRTGLFIATESGQNPGEIDCCLGRGRIRFNGVVKHPLRLFEPAGGCEQPTPPGEYHRVVRMAIEEGFEAYFGGADLATRSHDIGELHMCFNELWIEPYGLLKFGGRGTDPTLRQKLIAGLYMLLRRLRLCAGAASQSEAQENRSQCRQPHNRGAAQHESVSDHRLDHGGRLAMFWLREF